METTGELLPAEAPIKPLRNRKTRNTNMQSYLWEQVPRQLVQDAKRKAEANKTNLKRVLLRLLRDWTYEVQP